MKTWNLLYPGAMVRNTSHGWEKKMGHNEGSGWCSVADTMAKGAWPDDPVMSHRPSLSPSLSLALSLREPVPTAPSSEVARRRLHR